MVFQGEKLQDLGQLMASQALINTAVHHDLHSTS